MFRKIHSEYQFNGTGKNRSEVSSIYSTFFLIAARQLTSGRFSVHVMHSAERRAKIVALSSGEIMSPDRVAEVNRATTAVTGIKGH